MEEKRQEFQEEMVRNAVKFSELLEEVGAAGTEMEKKSSRSEDCRRLGTVGQGHCL